MMENEFGSFWLLDWLSLSHEDGDEISTVYLKNKKQSLAFAFPLPKQILLPTFLMTEGIENPFPHPCFLYFQLSLDQPPAY